jgi:hypothetical protein
MTTLTFTKTDAPEWLLAMWKEIDVETVYKGKIRPWGKTRKSLGVVHVPKELADDLWFWKQGCPNPSPEAFIFPNKKDGFMDSNN